MSKDSYDRRMKTRKEQKSRPMKLHANEFVVSLDLDHSIQKDKEEKERERFMLL